MMTENAVKSEMAKAETTDIFTLLPHRYPFLFVDRLLDIDGDRSATEIKSVTINEPYFQGQLPEKPVMPAILV